MKLYRLGIGSRGGYVELWRAARLIRFFYPDSMGLKRVIGNVPFSHQTQLTPPPPHPEHWGQGVVYRAGTSQVHCKEMDNVPSIYPLGTSQVHSEFSLPISMQFSQPKK